MGIEIETANIAQVDPDAVGSGGQPSQKGERRKGKRSRFLVSAATRIILVFL